jgi:hypothetical protein
MRRPLYYNDIKDLPPDHPLVIQFMVEAEAQLNIPVISPNDDEESLAYFDRYIAGDR